MLESGGDGFWAAIGFDFCLFPQAAHDIRAWPCALCWQYTSYEHPRRTRRWHETLLVETGFTRGKTPSPLQKKVDLA